MGAPPAWGHVAWPLETNYLPRTEPARERAVESVKVATRNQVKNLIPIVTNAELDNSGGVTEIYNRYSMDIMMGKIGLDAGIAQLAKKWREQGGDQMLADVGAYCKAMKK